MIESKRKRLNFITKICTLATLVSSIILPAQAFAATGARHVTVGDDVFLGGNYIEVGISKSGSFGSASPAPAGFHPTRITNLGFNVDGDGYDTGNPMNSGDYFLPGTPYEAFIVGYRDGSAAGTIKKFQNYERGGTIQIPSVTTDISSVSTLAAKTEGTTTSGKLKVEQTVSFSENDKGFKVNVILTNVSETDTLYDTRYARSVDPDVDADYHGDYDTKNSVIKNPPLDAQAVVIAKGPVTGNPFILFSADPRARASIGGADPYAASVYDTDGSKLLKAETTADSYVAMAFAFGDLTPGQSVTFEYIESLNPDLNAALDDLGNSAPPANTAPTVSNAVYSVMNTSVLTGDLIATDAESDPLTYRIISQGNKGTVTQTVAGGKAFVYTPTAGATGSDSFTFVANDGKVDSSPATVSITILPSNNADLKALEINPGSLDTAFVSSTNSYTTTVSYSTSSLSVTGTVYNENSTLKVNGVTTVSGSVYENIPLNVGPNTITVEVTAQDGTTKKAYTINANRLPSDKADLKALTLSTGNLDPAFVSSTTSYSTIVANGVNNVTVTGIVYDSTATIRVNSVVTASGAASLNIPLNVGVNTIKVEVTAQDGTTIKTYTIHANRLPSDKADLKALTLSAGNLDPAFASSTTSYNTIVANGINNVTVTGIVYDSTATIRVNGIVTASGAASLNIPLNVGMNTIKVEVTAQDGTTIKTYTINVNRFTENLTTSSGGGTVGSGGSGTVSQPNGVKIVVDGVVQEQSATAKTDKIGDQSVTIITVDNDKVIAKLEKESNKVLTIPVTGSSDVVVGELNGKLVKAMEGKDVVIEIKTDRATYTLPASQINIDSISAQLGSNIKLEDIKISIKIALSVPTTAATIQKSAADGNITIVGTPVDFEVTATLNGKTVAVNQFQSYVERQITLPADVNASQITTAVVLNADGTLTHVPTKLVTLDGKINAIINSLTNSSYSVVFSPKTFADVESHWSKQDVNDMASRLVVQGVTDQAFQPDKSITRAEFTAIMVRALGLKSGMGTEMPKDVKASDWYAGVVQTGVSYKLISGYEDGTFRPDLTITRKEAAAMVARALTLAKLNNGLTGDEVTKQLELFTDGSKIPAWAKNDLAAAVKNSIMQGDNGKISPDDNVTRAQTAAMLRRLLQQANLINK
ncbi:S-layer homology domain-containing protein [Paenibacillus sp. 1_12]|uniref:cadherin-like beta sandwich domain-containing protein n=1 Tax=Paenibacillus sp. 1_12 TaxID=1566278 RepID=UPI0008E45908|nr:cadherin-like beta sandwich domain-containing protein [Paenibacillus sp. 1_12]SFL65210.1 S-layer homology domain-containing protein [Paenibacillus sp. 1_12]